MSTNNEEYFKVEEITVQEVCVQKELKQSSSKSNSSSVNCVTDHQNSSVSTPKSTSSPNITSTSHQTYKSTGPSIPCNIKVVPFTEFHKPQVPKVRTVSSMSHVAGNKNSRNNVLILSRQAADKRKSDDSEGPPPIFTKPTFHTPKVTTTVSTLINNFSAYCTNNPITSSYKTSHHNSVNLNSCKTAVTSHSSKNLKISRCIKAPVVSPTISKSSVNTKVHPILVPHNTTFLSAIPQVSKSFSTNASPTSTTRCTAAADIPVSISSVISPSSSVRPTVVASNQTAALQTPRKILLHVIPQVHNTSSILPSMTDNCITTVPLYTSGCTTAVSSTTPNLSSSTRDLCISSTITAPPCNPTTSTLTNNNKSTFIPQAGHKKPIVLSSNTNRSKLITSTAVAITTTTTNSQLSSFDTCIAAQTNSTIAPTLRTICHSSTPKISKFRHIGINTMPVNQNSVAVNTCPVSHRSVGTATSESMLMRRFNSKMTTTLTPKLSVSNRTGGLSLTKVSSGLTLRLNSNTCHKDHNNTTVSRSTPIVRTADSPNRDTCNISHSLCSAEMSCDIPFCDTTEAITNRIPTSHATLVTNSSASVTSRLFVDSIKNTESLASQPINVSQTSPLCGVQKRLRSISPSGPLSRLKMKRKVRVKETIEELCSTSESDVKGPMKLQSHVSLLRSRSTSSALEEKVEMKAAVVAGEETDALTTGEAEFVRQELVNLLNLALATSNSPELRFLNSSVVEPGWLILTCHNTTSLEWLLSLKPMTGPEGRLLKVIRMLDLIWPCEIRLFLSGQVLETSAVLSLLQKQNQKLEVKKWKVVKLEKESGGTSFTFLIDGESEKVLEQEYQWTLCYEFSTIPVHCMRKKVL